MYEGYVMARLKGSQEIRQLAIKWEVSEATIYELKKRLLKEFNFCECKHIDIFLEDRYNIKKLTQQLLLEKGAIDIIDLFDNYYMRAYRFIVQIFSLNNTITDNQYNQCMLIINKFDNLNGSSE